MGANGRIRRYGGGPTSAHTSREAQAQEGAEAGELEQVQEPPVRRVAATLGLIAILVGNFPTKASAAALSAPGDIYLALGNSLSVGVEAPANNDGQPGYPALLYGRMQALNPALEYINVGAAGETSATLISGGQLGAATSAISAATSAGKCVGAITLDIGGNDFGQILTGETTPEAAISGLSSNLDTILSHVTSAAHSQVAGCSPHMALMAYYNPYPGLKIPPSNQALADIYLPQLNEIIADRADRYGWSVANVEPLFRGREADLLYVNQGIYSNPLLLIPFLPWFEGNVDFHPRPAGHDVIADAFWQALQLTTPAPQPIDLPDLVLANVALVSPWHCGACEATGSSSAGLQPLPEPSTVNLEWLGAQLWNRVSLPVLCWNLAIFQAGLNIYAATLNTIWLPAFNELWRLIYGLFFWLTSAFSAWWYLGEDLRYQVWMVNSTLAGMSSGALASTASAGDGLAEALEAWALVFAAGLQTWGYLVNLYVSSASAVFVVMGDLTNHRPAQLVAIENVWLFAALKGVIRGIWESQLGWWVAAQIGLLYLATVLHVFDEVAEV